MGFESVIIPLTALTLIDGFVNMSSTQPEAIPSESKAIATTSSGTAVQGIPLVVSVPTILVVSVIFFTVLNYLFPVFIIAEELRRPFPPDGIAAVREIAFARCRLTNTLLAIASVTLVLAIVLPLAMILTKRFPQQALRNLIPVAVASSAVACLGVLLGHAVMEFTTPQGLGITRTFLAHWFEFGFLGTAIGLSIACAIGNAKLGIDICIKGMITGLIAATLFDLVSVVMPQTRLDTLIPGGALWGSHDTFLIGLYVAFLLPPLALGFRKFEQKAKA
jgi:hypothetical protein